MDKQQLQMLELLGKLGINLDPMAQMGGLVNILNASEKPQQDREMFDSDQQLRREMFQGESAQRDAALHAENQRFQQGLKQQDQSMQMQGNRYREAGLMQLFQGLIGTPGMESQAGPLAQMLNIPWKKSQPQQQQQQDPMRMGIDPVLLQQSMQKNGVQQQPMGY